MPRLFLLAGGVLRAMAAIGAVLAFLLHGAAAAPAAAGSYDQAARAAIHIEHAVPQDGHGHCAPGLGKTSCCGTACFVTLLPGSSQVATAGTCGRQAPNTIRAIAGIEPEGPRRPPRLT